MVEMRMTRVNEKLVHDYVKKHPVLKPFLEEGKRGFQTLVGMMLRKALEAEQ